SGSSEECGGEHRANGAPPNGSRTGNLAPRRRKQYDFYQLSRKWQRLAFRISSRPPETELSQASCSRRRRGDGRVSIRSDAGADRLVLPAASFTAQQGIRRT